MKPGKSEFIMVHVHMQAIPALYCYKYGKYDVWEEYRRHCTLNAMLQWISKIKSTTDIVKIKPLF